MAKNQAGEGGCLLLKEDLTRYPEYAGNIMRAVKIKLAGEMAAGIAHEIRNPMTAVRGLLQVLEKEAACPGFAEYLQVMLRELDQANAVISEVLLLAPAKASKTRLLQLNDLLFDLLPAIAHQARQSGSQVLFEPGNIPPLWLNEQEISKLICNLVYNGLEAMPEGGNLTVKTFLDDPDVVLAVQDQGKGIKVDVLNKLGIPFFTTKDHGTGLGLAVCYSVAARHNANIVVETGTKGSTFLVRFQPQP
ncbi:ATP-binding protein [Desulforamulus hydrothermalis]|uniref:histidine kinase n=1 Tax=Desulforamulus hydrothermalis Lam5 = DSM 18033 TaxID=1121428 RepID=K8DY17_9FIRM